MISSGSSKRDRFESSWRFAETFSEAFEGIRDGRIVLWAVAMPYEKVDCAVRLFLK